jgi:hypothetical protein
MPGKQLVALHETDQLQRGSGSFGQKGARLCHRGETAHLEQSRPLAPWRAHEDAILSCQPHIELAKGLLQLLLVGAAEYHDSGVGAVAQGCHAVIHPRIYTRQCLQVSEAVSGLCS